MLLWSAPRKQWDSILALNRTFRLPLEPQKKQILIYGCLHWMQLDSSFNLSQFWALSAFFWPRYAIFREPFFHRLTKKPNSPQFCYLSLAHHPIQCQHENFGCWGCPWLTRLISEPTSYKIFTFQIQPRDGGPLKSAHFAHFGYLFGAFIRTCQTKFWRPTK